MFGTEFIAGQGLGNQLFCYVTARAVAEENGYEFGTAGQERFAVNIHNDRGMYFMDVDLGHLPPMMPLVTGSMAKVTAKEGKLEVRMEYR